MYVCFGHAFQTDSLCCSIRNHTHKSEFLLQTTSREQEQAIEQAKKQWISNAMAAQLEQVC